MTDTVPALVNPETAPYWAAAADRRLLLKSCRRCGEPHFYPRSICPHCFSPDTEWIEASGAGEVYSFSVMRRAGEPYVIAYVALDEGVTMLTNIVGPDCEAVRIGDRVAVDFVEGAGRWLPVFTRDRAKADS